jgi:hypothetical protein
MRRVLRIHSEVSLGNAAAFITGRDQSAIQSADGVILAALEFWMTRTIDHGIVDKRYLMPLGASPIRTVSTFILILHAISLISASSKIQD